MGRGEHQSDVPPGRQDVRVPENRRTSDAVLLERWRWDPACEAAAAAGRRWSTRPSREVLHLRLSSSI